MNIAWWLESLWRTAIVAAATLALLLAIGILQDAWQQRKAVWTFITDHAWYRFPIAQRRLIERWERTQPWRRWGMADWVSFKLAVIDRRSRGKQNTYRLLREFLNNQQEKQEKEEA